MKTSRKSILNQRYLKPKGKYDGKETFTSYDSYNKNH